MSAAPSVPFPFKGSDSNAYSGQTLPIDVNGNVAVALPPGAALDASLQSILTALTKQRSESLWTDDSGAYYVRVEIGGVLTWTDLSGNALSTPGTGARPAAGSTVLLSRSSYQATTAGSGYSSGDYVDHFVTTDPASGAVLGNFWIDVTTGAKLTTAPASANVSPIAPLPTGAATNAVLAPLLPATSPGTPGTAALSVQGNASGIPMPVTTTPAGLGSTGPVPAGTANGTPLGTLPTGARGARLYTPVGTSITFMIASAAPSAPPAWTFTASNSGSGWNWDEDLAAGQMIYVTAIAGAPGYRWY